MVCWLGLFFVVGVGLFVCLFGLVVGLGFLFVDVLGGGVYILGFVWFSGGGWGFLTLTLGSFGNSATAL